MRTRHSRRGFTLVELLVVIAIIALLISMLMPALAKARLAAMVNQGQANLSSISKGVYNYATDNNAWGPLDGGNGGIRLSCSAPGGRYYMKHALGTWTIWDSRVYTQVLPNTAGTYAGVGPVGLGVLASIDSPNCAGLQQPTTGDYINSPVVFFHPVMRDFMAGGGGARHWWTYSSQGLKRFSTVASTVPWPGGASNSNINASLNYWMDSSVAYRGGDWTPNDEMFAPASPATLAGTPGYNYLPQAKVDFPGYNIRTQLMYNLFENMGARCGGQIDYTRGDGSVATTRHPKLIGNFSKGFSSNLTVYALWQDAVTTFPNVPAGAHPGGTSNGTPGGPGTVWWKSLSDATGGQGMGNKNGVPHWMTLIDKELGVIDPNQQ